MKKTIVILIALCFTLMAQGQWHSNQYNVTDMNELTKAQLEMSMDQAIKLKKGGMITTGLSTVLTIVGTVMYANGLDDIISATTYGGIDDGLDKGLNGALLMYVGVAGMSVGIPLWIIGAQRENSVKVHLVKFDQMGFNSPRMGVGFSYNF